MDRVGHGDYQGDLLCDDPGRIPGLGTAWGWVVREKGLRLVGEGVEGRRSLQGRGPGQGVGRLRTVLVV